MDKNGDGVVTKEANIKQDLYAENYYNICFKCKYKYYAKKNIGTDHDNNEIWLK